MKYLVLGSAGQIGSALVKRIQENTNDEVFLFDIEHHASQDLRMYNNHVLDAAVKESDFVFFLAFDVGGSRYLQKYQDTYDFISNNLKIIDRTFDVLKKYNKPFIFASSQMANMSYSNYGLLKSVGEKMTGIVGGLVVKFWNVYGLEHDKDKFHVITDLIIKAATTNTIDLMTDGTEERQFLFADDCSDCLLKLANQYKEVPRTKELHITSFEWTTILNIANLIASHFPGSQVIPATSKDEVQKNKRNEPDTFIRTYWEPKTSIQEGISLIVNEMLTKPQDYPGMPIK